MSSEHNRLRKKWQDYSGGKAALAEANFYDSFREFFKDTDYCIRKQPNEFAEIYVDYPLSKKEASEIYTPEDPIEKHGVLPDYAIDNTITKKTIYVEVKRQDGWVEGGTRSDGRGNAHERSCKFFTPGLLKVMRKKSGIKAPNLPFWTVFQGDITRDPCRVREITCWYEGVESHFFLWRHSPDPSSLIEHFVDNLAPLLEKKR